MARGVTRTIRKSPDLAELVVAQSAHPDEKGLHSERRQKFGPSGPSRASTAVLGLKARQAQDKGAGSVSADPQVAPAPREQAQNQFRLQVDRQTKASYPTLEAAKAAGLAIKQNHPILHVAVCDVEAGVNKVIELPKS
jgi:hypothetical protein